MDGDLNKEEASVGAMLPVTTPDQVFEKKINTDFDALRLSNKPATDNNDITPDEDIDTNKPMKETTPTFNDNINNMIHESGMDWFDKVADAGEVYLEDSDDEYFEESARNIDADLKEVIGILNKKGYKTKYSCSGHRSSRDKNDVYRDGIKNKKIYSTARIVFDKIYDLPNIPKYWEKKILDEGEDAKTAMYVKAPTFKIINGLPLEQFDKWKDRYMYNLRKWADELPDEKDTKESDNSKVALESVDDTSALLDELIIDTF